MKYHGNPDYRHGSIPATGILLANLGTPDAPSAGALRRYLRQFLSDPRVIETSRLIWWPILHGLILRRRPRKSAAAYRRIWHEDSPLRAISMAQAGALRARLNKQCMGPVHVALGMRYGRPSIADAAEALNRAGTRRLLLLPLYPQYSAATTASTFDALATVLRRQRWLPELRMVLHYGDHPGYISALTESIRSYRQQQGTDAHLLFSFHGLPRHYFLAGDPYHCECHKTARLTAERLQLPDDAWSVSFQSRFGPRAWLQPYTDKVLHKLARKGIKQVQVVCPGFSADCLETLEEVSLLYGAQFRRQGGNLQYIPALNDSPGHIQFLADLIAEHTGGWPECVPVQTGDTAARDAVLQANRQRALDMGAKN